MQPAAKIIDFPGSRIDRFIIKRKLGCGAMGDVFLAEDSVLRRQVAIKAVRPEQSRDAAFHQRMQKEAERRVATE